MATQNIFNLTDTWNNVATTFTAIKMNVTDTASATGSLLLDLQVEAASQFSVSKAGVGTFAGNINATGTIAVSGSFLNATTLRIGNSAFQLSTSGVPASSITSPASLWAQASTAIPAGGTAGVGLLLSSTTSFGVFFGSGAPTLSAAKGSLYLRSDGSGINDRMYVNTNGSTTWTAVVTAA